MHQRQRKRNEKKKQLHKPAKELILYVMCHKRWASLFSLHIGIWHWYVNVTRARKRLQQNSPIFFFFLWCANLLFIARVPLECHYGTRCMVKNKSFAVECERLEERKRPKKKKWQRKMSLHARRNVSSRRMGAKRSHGREVARGRRNSKKKHSVKECEYELSFSHQQNNFHKYFYCLLFSPFLPFKR